MPDNNTDQLLDAPPLGDPVGIRQVRKKLNWRSSQKEECFRALFDCGPLAIYSCDASGMIQEFNSSAVELWGREPKRGDPNELYCGSFRLFRPDGSKLPRELTPVVDVLSGKIPSVRDAEVVMERPDGTRITVMANIVPLMDDEGTITGVMNCMYEVTALKRTETLLAAQNEILELAAGGGAIVDILQLVVRSARRHSGEQSRASVFLLEPDGLHLRFAVAEGLDERYTQAVDHFEVGPHSPSCGSAAFTGQPVICSDVDEDPLWAPFLSLPHEFDFRAVWSQPLRTVGGKVLGTLALYHREPRVPGPGELEAVKLLSQTAALVIDRILESQKRQEADAALRESEERYRSLFDSIDEGFCVIEMIYNAAGRPIDYRFLEVNSAFEKQSGLFEAVGKRARELVPDLEPQWAETYGAIARTGEPYRSTIEVKSMNRWLDLYACQVGGPESQKVAVVFNDVTERRAAEELLRQSERRLRFVLDSMPQKIVTAKPNGDFDYINPQWTDYTGISFEQIKDCGWKLFIHPDDLEETLRLWTHSVASGELYLQEHRLRRADGAYRWHLSRTLALRDDVGQVMMWVGASTDIHVQRQAANELRKYATDLSEADRRKNEFLAMLAHELRNPLAPIRNALQMLRLTGGNGAAVASVSEMMERQIGHMARLVDDLLDVSRISSGKIELRRERVPLASVVQLAVEATRSLYQSMNHELMITLPAQPIMLNADPTRLSQVIGNLLNNACKFTNNGGHISLTVERNGELPSPFVLIRVKDNGIGIATDQLPRIFEMFTQVDTSLERSVSGLGIGLALVKNLVELHNGTVEVHSEGVGFGSEFVVRLPILADQPKLIGHVLPNNEVPPTVACRILVVDDNEDSATSLAMLLEMTGNETSVAYDGNEAVAKAETLQPDVILMDIGLPGLNGYEAARKIRENHWGERIVMVALTGWGHEEDRQKSKEAGFDGHLVKPVKYATLMEVLTKLLRRIERSETTALVADGE